MDEIKTIRSICNQGFWGYPASNLLVPVSCSHVKSIIHSPLLFGFQGKEEIWEYYRNHREKRGIEGKAREELIRIAVQRGWIRIRHYGRENYYSINCGAFSDQNRHFIQSFFMGLLEGLDPERDGVVLVERDPGARVKIDCFDRPERWFQVGDFIRGGRIRDRLL